MLEQTAVPSAKFRRLEPALKGIERHSVIALGASDQRAFVEALLSPPAPSPRLRAAWRRHQKPTLR